MHVKPVVNASPILKRSLGAFGYAVRYAFVRRSEGRMAIGRTVTLLLFLLAPFEADAGPHGWSTASSVGRDALVVAAFGVPLVRRDYPGDLDAAESLAAAGGVTFLLKQTISEQRPDRSDDHSVPSGHTSISFAAASSLEQRYGWRVGFPALAVAAFVGIARVEADKHYWHDVVAGAAIGSASGFLLTRRLNDGVQLAPWAGRHGGGMAVSARF